MRNSYVLSLLFASACHLAHTTTVSIADAGLPDGPPLATRAQAIVDTIAHDPACELPAFYWEIGDVHGALVSGQVGRLYGADTNIDIASASKLVFGSYVVERFKDDLGAANFDAMTMRIGYTSFTYDSCVRSASVADCQKTAHNGDHNAADDGFFDYGGGHFQKYAVDLGLGGDDDVALAARMNGMLGLSPPIAYSSPQLAAGIHTSASTYAAFLRRILDGSLAIAAHLGENAVCTLPSACPAAHGSPVPEAWHYSWGHWIEDAPGVGDGAFSSPGALGFYPWISADKRYYGILARWALSGSAATDSVSCGRLLRRAFMEGTAQ